MELVLDDKETEDFLLNYDKELYKKVMDFDLSIARERFRANNRFGLEADPLEIECKRFLFMTSLELDFALVPSSAVDEFWHMFILDTSTYRDFCETLFGKIIEHKVDIPTSDKKVKDEFNSDYQKTISLYTKLWGKPDKSYWPYENELLERYKRPHRIHLETTQHCNLRCEHCYPESGPDKEHHDFNRIIEVIHHAKQEGVKKVTLTGGELLTRTDWKEILTETIENIDNVYFITNGINLKKSDLEWLAKKRTIKTLKNFLKGHFSASDVGIAISLDGLKGNEIVRVNVNGVGVDSEKILDKIKLAVNHGLHVTVNTTVTNDKSASELYEMYQILKDIGIDRWQIDQAYLAGRYVSSNIHSKDLSWLEIAKDNYERIVRDYLKDYPKLPDFRLEIVQVFRYDFLFYGLKPAANLEEHPCDYQFGSVIIENTDELRFCPSLRYDNAGLEHIDTSRSYYSLLSSSQELQNFSDMQICDLPCRDCRYVLIHHGGCRANSVSYNGKILDRDPICCALSPFVEERIVPLLPQFLQKQFYDSLRGGKVGEMQLASR
jgi:radical SAM protein with 4Fe4S-binding SPASM domain